MLENQGKVGMVLNVVPVQSTRVILMMKATAWDGAKRRWDVIVEKEFLNRKSVLTNSGKLIESLGGQRRESWPSDFHCEMRQQRRNRLWQTN